MHGIFTECCQTEDDGDAAFHGGRDVIRKTVGGKAMLAGYDVEGFARGLRVESV